MTVSVVYFEAVAHFHLLNCTHFLSVYLDNCTLNLEVDEMLDALTAYRSLM